MGINFPQVCFLALEPEDEVKARVQAYKQRTAELAGPQLFLDDPPHLTLYLAVFPAAVAVLRMAASVVRLGRMPAATISGWHIFTGDQLTGNNTLVFALDGDGCQHLSLIQQQVVASVAPLRDSQVSQDRYAASWRRLSDEEKANVEVYGFPFVGAIWQPHLTVASIRTEQWQDVWSDLRNNPPSGSVRFPHLGVYTLEENRPKLLERFTWECPP